VNSFHFHLFPITSHYPFIWIPINSTYSQSLPIIHSCEFLVFPTIPDHFPNLSYFQSPLIPFVDYCLSHFPLPFSQLIRFSFPPINTSVQSNNLSLSQSSPISVYLTSVQSNIQFLHFIYIPSAYFVLAQILSSLFNPMIHNYQYHFLNLF